MMSGGESDKIFKDGASTKSNNDGVCDVNDKLKNMSTADKEDVSICANCGKEGISDKMNTCNKCNVVKYCNAVCKKVHKKKHKNDCEEHVRLAAEKHNEKLRIAAELHDIELFKDPPSQHGDCPICFERIPNLNTGWKYRLCCGKLICSGCCHAPVYDNQGNKVDSDKCPFCRTPSANSHKEEIERRMKLFEADNAIAIYNQGLNYYQGERGFRKNYDKALELWDKAGHLGHAMAYCNIGVAYYNGQGVEVDKKKATHYYELAAMGGNEVARHNLGLDEEDAGNMDRALKHYMIAVRGGLSESLKAIQKLYSKGHATKDDYMEALQSYQAYLGEIKSKQRDEAAADSEECRYY